MKEIEAAIKNALSSIEQSDLIIDGNYVKENFLEEMDSITLMTFLLSLEDTLGKKFSWKGLEKQMTYKKFVKYIAKEIE